MWKMAYSGKHGKIEVCKGFVQPIGPGGGKDNAVSPTHARRQVNWGLRGQFTAYHRKAARILADVPIEAALEGSGPHEIVDPNFECIVNPSQVAGPVAHEVPNIGGARFSRRADELCGPWELVEGLIPNLF